ncbi:PrgI family protein [Streptomyces sp. NPDC042319]|uniref:PrgI family protein n=1 Tax=Streptomyces sp. NPDC042319 TaxID=3154332 RepID=UPI00340D3B69
MTEHDDDLVTTARIPADVGRADKVLGPLTARQAAILAVAGLTLYGGYWAARPLMAPLTYLAMVTPVAGVIAAITLGSREGIGLDSFLRAALGHVRTPKRRVHAPEGVPPLPDAIPADLAEAAGPPPTAMRMPYEGVAPPGVLDLGSDGHAALATCSTVNFSLRSGAEQQGLVAAFARWLNSLTGPTQLLVRCHRTELSPLADELYQRAPSLPHPALERAARAHAEFLAYLASTEDLLTRQIVLVAREETPPHRGRPHAGVERVIQRIHEATRALAPAEITLAPLDATRTAELVTAACNPDSPALSSEEEEDL